MSERRLRCGIGFASPPPQEGDSGRFSFPRRCITLGVFAVTGVLGCSDELAGTQPLAARSEFARSLSGMSSCGASFRLISTEDDSLMAPYDVVRTTDTVDVCESWTGTDYQYEARMVGSSDNVELVDDVQSVSYASGYITGYGASGSPTVSSVEAGPTAFDFMNADDATRQASYDYPYYGVSSPDAGCSGCVALISRSSAVPGDTASRQAATEALPFARHGLTRVAVRALVNGADELPRSREGWRRFRKTTAEETTIFSVDPLTQLVVAEEIAGRVDTMLVRHVWRRVAGGHVRERSDMEIVERIGGKRIRNRTTLVFQNVQVTDPRFPTIKGPEARP